MQGQFKWAMAGRNKRKVELVRTELAKQAPSVEQVEVVTADIGDQASLEGMCGAADVVLSLVGPYAKYGKPLVKVSPLAWTHGTSSPQNAVHTSLSQTVPAAKGSAAANEQLPSLQCPCTPFGRETVACLHM